MIETNIYYSFDDDQKIIIGLKSSEINFQVIEKVSGSLLHSDSITFSVSRAECSELSAYFEKLSKELNKLRELG